MTKMLVYSHDTYGLGNIRRMLAICTHMAEVLPNLSILLELCWVGGTGVGALLEQNCYKVLTTDRHVSQ
ncbi:MAG TPA: hypothetical protein VNY05_38220 [Candidatus Acidoferrales bacterium]|jgi:predicted glycosyltransferase|nr:hypothetical protein [Candidatus Acidoferrales bacterium]